MSAQIEPFVKAQSSADLFLDPKKASTPQESCLNQLIKGQKVRRYDNQEVLYHQGADIRQIFILQRGAVKLVAHHPYGYSRIVRLAGAQHWLGLEALFGEPFQQSAIAINDTVATSISLSRLRAMLAQCPALYDQVMRQWFQYLSMADRWIAEFSSGTIRTRVLCLLRYLLTLQPDSSDDIVELLSVREMADILAVAPETVSRILAELKRTDLLRKCPNSLKTRYRVDMEKLEYQQWQNMH